MLTLYCNFILTILRECFSSIIFIIPLGLIVLITAFSYFKRLS